MRWVSHKSSQKYILSRNDWMDHLVNDLLLGLWIVLVVFSQRISLAFWPTGPVSNFELYCRGRTTRNKQCIVCVGDLRWKPQTKSKAVWLYLHKIKNLIELSWGDYLDEIGDSSNLIRVEFVLGHPYSKGNLLNIIHL